MVYFGFINSLWGGINNQQSSNFLSPWFGNMNSLRGGIPALFSLIDPISLQGGFNDPVFAANKFFSKGNISGNNYFSLYSLSTPQVFEQSLFLLFFQWTCFKSSRECWTQEYHERRWLTYFPTYWSFPNTACSGGAQNGTCYTEAECASRYKFHKDRCNFNVVKFFDHKV